jgi:hypothetical protein
MNLRTAISICSLFAALAALVPIPKTGAPDAPANPAVPPAGFYALAGFEPHDGDTFKADILLPWGVTLRDQHVRCAGYDAWEITRGRQTVEVTDAEIEKGKAALAGLQGLCSGAVPFLSPVYDAKGRQLDSVYGRLQGRLIVRLDSGEVVDVAKWMALHGHCRQ